MGEMEELLGSFLKIVSLSDMRGLSKLTEH